MKAFKQKGFDMVYQYIGKADINGRMCFMTGEFTGIFEDACEFVDDKPWVQAYVRLMSYQEACTTVSYCRSIGAEAYITVGGFSITASEEGWDKIIQYIEGMGVRYELSFKHPTDTINEIIENYKQQNDR